LTITTHRLLVFAFLPAIAGLLFPFETAARQEWFKGNVHVHTSNSDGNTPANEVVAWYKEHGYHFVVITDHDQRTPVSTLNDEFAVSGEFIVLAGVEVSDRVGRRPVHLNGIGIRENVLPHGGETVPAAIDANAIAIRNAGGLSILNHPNGLLRVALTAEEIAASREIRHFEICCSSYLGGSGQPSTEVIWDNLLSGGMTMYGIAADDAHSFDPYSPDPGKAWIMVRAESLSQSAILSAIDIGDFYSTTGVILADLSVTENQMCLSLAEFDSHGYRTVFIGTDGAELAWDETERPCYEFQPHDTYVRAKVIRSNGAIAWVQPVTIQ